LGPKRIRVMTSTFQVSWRHRSRGHSIPHRLFPVCFFRQFSSKMQLLY